MNVIWSFLTTLTVNSGIPDKLLESNQTWDHIIGFFTGDGNGSMQHNYVVDFYRNWDQYLTTKRMVFVQIEGTLNNWITKGLYDAANSLENTFNAVLKLFGIFGELNSGDAGKLYKLVVSLAFILLTIGLCFIFIEMMIKVKTKFHDVIQSMIVTIAVCIMLPFGINLFGQVVLHGSEMLESGYSDSSRASSITIAPIQNNVVDVLMLTKDKFNTDPRTIGENKNPTSNYNDITSDNLDHLDFSEVIAKDNLDTIPGRKEKNPGQVGPDSVLERVDNVFKYQLKVGTSSKKNGKTTSNNYYVADATLPDKQSSLTKAFSPVRARYQGHWLLIDLLLITIGSLFAFIAFRVGKSWYEIFMLNMVAPLMGLQDLHGNQRIKEILMAIQGTFISVFTEVIGIRVFMILVQYVSSKGNPALQFLGKQQNPAMTITFFTVIMYIACFMALLNGINLIERWTGVPQGHHDGLAGFMMGTGALMKGAGFLGNNAMKATTAVLGKENGILRDDSLPAQRRNAALNNPANPDLNNEDDSDQNDNGDNDNSNVNDNLNYDQENEVSKETKNDVQENDGENPADLGDNKPNNGSETGDEVKKKESDNDSDFSNPNPTLAETNNFDDNELDDLDNYDLDQDPTDTDRNELDNDSYNLDGGIVPNPAEKVTQNVDDEVNDDKKSVPTLNHDTNHELVDKDNLDNSQVPNPTRKTEQSTQTEPDPTNFEQQNQQENDGVERIDSNNDNNPNNSSIGVEDYSGINQKRNNPVDVRQKRQQSKVGKRTNNKLSSRSNILEQMGDNLENLARKDQNSSHESTVNPPEIEVDDSIY